MKKLFYIKTALVSLLATALLSSCLKDDSRLIDFSGDAPVVDFPIVAVKLVYLQTATISASAPTNTINAEISIGAPHDYTTPTTVTVVVDPAVLAAYSGNSGLSVLPATTYTVAGSLTTNIFPGISERAAPNLPVVGATVALPTSLGSVSFTVNTAAVLALPAGTYVLPLRIASATGNGAIIDQYNTLMYKIVIGK
jgi:hypothetical protein